MTINSNEIISAINQHGIPVFHTSEINKPILCRESVCNLADIIAVYKQSERFYVVGIEIKEWDKRVHPKMAMEYLETYRGTCEYFYLAAKKFSKGTLELKDIGLFDLSRMKVVKNPGYLYPNMEFRSNLMARIRNNFKVLTNAVEDPFQKTILEFY
ncbi:hypothetical protein METP3_00268 [Methanosarcinales archaeon]|nr:hypothetical protein METP3_00268 [Methanosarcinales archaeon]